MARPKAHTHTWEARRDEIFDCVYRLGWLQRDLAEWYGVTRERMRQVMRELGLPYSHSRSTPLWCDWPRPSSPRDDDWHRCAGTLLSGEPCQREVYKSGRGHGLCDACYSRYRRRHYPGWRAKHKELMRRWREDHPGNARDIQKRATAAYYARLTAEGRCIMCRRPLTHSGPVMRGQRYCIDCRLERYAYYRAKYVPVSQRGYRLAEALGVDATTPLTDASDVAHDGDDGPDRPRADQRATNPDDQTTPPPPR